VTVFSQEIGRILTRLGPPERGAQRSLHPIVRAHRDLRRSLYDSGIGRDVVEVRLLGARLRDNHGARYVRVWLTVRSILQERCAPLNDDRSVQGGPV
jgi:hypothetical protein